MNNINLAVKKLNSLLVESKQSIVNLGFPEVIASILYEKYGKNAFVVSKWYKDYFTDDYEAMDNKTWWRRANTEYSLKKLGLTDLIMLYDAAKISFEEYNKIKKQLELEIDDTQEFNKSEKLQDLREEISRGFFKKVFFSRNLIIGIDSGKIIDLHPYANLTFREANEKYEKKSIFSDKTPVKKYPNGWRWVDAGAKCDLIGGMMKNCGSTGVMSADKDRTMLTLFDEQNIPHVVATYSPNEKRISGVEGQASTAVKNEYADYVIDLVKTLGAELDYDREKSKFLKLKYALGNKLKSLKKIPNESDYDEYYVLVTSDNKTYYTNSYEMISKEDVDKINFKMFKPQPKNITEKTKLVFGYYNKEKILDTNPDVKYIRDSQFINQINLQENVKSIIKSVIREMLLGIDSR
jgi:hypothetical protein